jgi:hypothetical protein
MTAIAKASEQHEIPEDIQDLFDKEQEVIHIPKDAETFQLEND